MALFKVANGPWEKLFTGAFQKHEVELYSNPDKILMILIYEKKLDRTEGAIIELYKAFHAVGDVESFTETLPREALVVTKHDENLTIKFLLLGSKPTYVRWVEDEFVGTVDSLVKRLEASSVLIKDVSKAYELSLEEMSNTSEEVKKAFFAQPMLPPLLATSYHAGVSTAEPLQKQQATVKGEVMIGITRDRQRVIEPLQLFAKTIVSEGEKGDRVRVMAVVGESALLSNTPTIFFDFGKNFGGIGEANKNAQELQKYMVEIDPLGFPLKTFKPKESLRIDLNSISPEALAEALGVGEKDFPRVIVAALKHGKTDSMEQLIEKVSKMPPTEEFSEFEILKTARILRLISVRYPFLFGGENDIGEMARAGTSNIARASVLEFEGVDSRSTVLLCHSLLKELFEFYKHKGPSQTMRALVIIPSVQVLQPKAKQKIVAQEMLAMLKEFPKYGIGYIVAAEHLIDIEPTFREQAEALLNIVSGNDLGVQFKNRKAYRVMVRATLSKAY